MFTSRIQWIVLISSLAWCAPESRGSALTYAFSGTLSQPYQGSTQFSGTFTYATDLPPYPGISPYPGAAYYSGVPNDPTEPVVSLAFTFGSISSSSLGTLSSDELIVDHNLGGSPQGGDLFQISEQFIKNGAGTSANATIAFGNDNLIQRAPFTSTDPPPSLSLADFSRGGNLTVEMLSPDGHDTNLVGTITSLTETSGPSQVPVPEPTSLLIFAGLAAAISARRLVNSDDRSDTGRRRQSHCLGRLR